MLESLFNKTADLKACNLIRKRILHRCFLVNIAKFLRTAFLPNMSGGCFCFYMIIMINRKPQQKRRALNAQKNGRCSEKKKKNQSHFEFENIEFFTRYGIYLSLISSKDYGSKSSFRRTAKKINLTL